MNGATTQIELPAGVRRQLAAFRRRLWLTETISALAGGVCGLLAAYLVLFLSDRVWDTPVWARAVLAVGGLAAGATAAWYWGARWVWRRRGTTELAALVQRQFPGLGDRLLGIVELASQDRGAAGASPALLRAALAQVAQETDGLDFRQAVSPRWLRWWLVAGLGLVAVVAAGVGWLPAAGTNAWRRLTQPLATIARYTLVGLRGLPEQLVVAHGEPFAVTAQLDGQSRWRPSRARARFEAQPPVTAPVNAMGAVRFELPGQRAPGTLAVKVGDARAAVVVQPEFRPELKELRAVIELPEYLGQPVATQSVVNGSLEVVTGSRLTLAGRVSRALAEVTEREPWRVAHDEFWSPTSEVITGATLAIQWRDALGLTSREPYAVHVRARPDQPPAVECRGLDRVTAILEDEVLEFSVQAEDDFGVRAVGVTWESEGRAEAGVAATNGAWTVAAGGQQQPQVTGRVRFSPLALNLKPQKVTVRAQATDYQPGRAAALSKPHTIYVVDKLDHAKLVQEQFERLLEKLEEIARTEEGLFQINETVREQVTAGDTAQRLAEQERAERANTEALRRLQEEGMKLLADALRNQTIDEQVLARWTELLQKLDQLAREGLPRVTQALAQARQQPGQRAEQMDTALAEQQRALEELSRLLNQMNEANQELVAGNFVGRLRQAASQERDIGGELRRLVVDTIGLPAEKLPPLLRGRLNRVQDRQRRAQQMVTHLQDDLEGFYSRTRQALYGEVFRAMDEARVTEELGKVAGLIAQNVGGQAITQTDRWATQFDAWAKLLSGEEDGGAGGGGGGGSPTAQLLELMLKLLRLRQTEEGLREQTRFFEEHKADTARYTPGVARVAELQQALIGNVQEISAEYPQPQLRGLLAEVESAMADAARLLAVPQTDQETIAAQTEVIELLGQTCKQSAGGGGGSGLSLQGLSPELLAFLMQMMGGSTGPTGGGSMAGGDTERVPETAVGPAAGAAVAERAVEQAGGRGGELLPAEFRDALEAYFQAMEDLEE